MLGMAYIKLGQVPESLNHYMEALKLLGHPMPKTDRMLTISLVKELLTQVSHRFQNNLQPNSREHKNYEREVELAHIDIEGALYFSQNVTKLAWGMLRRLNLAERVGMSVLMAEGYSNLLMIAGFANNQRLINLYRRLTWETVEQANRTSTRIYALLRDGVSLFVSCEWDQAGERFDTGIRLADQLGDDRQFGDLTASFATSLFLQGKYEQSLQRWNSSYQKKVKRDRFHSTAWSLYGQGHNRLMFGQIKDALRDLETSLHTPMRDQSDVILNTSLYGALSLAYLRNGQFNRAFENIIAHDKNATAPSTSSIICYYSASLDALLGFYEGVMNGSIHLDQSETTQLQQLVGRIPKSLTVMKNLPANQAGVWLYRGMYDHLTGKHKEAVADWKKSVESARRFNQPYELARASFELGQHLEPDAALQREYLAEACMIFESLGTTYELNLAKSALGELTSASMD
jgi:tetratricopeptide (TPR) repeat protein